MIEIGNSFDGTVEKAISTTEKLNGLPKLVQKFALAGDFSLGNAKKIDLSNYASDSKEFENYIALISTLDKKQRDLIVSMTDLGQSITKEKIAKKLKGLSDGTLLNGSVVERVLNENDFSKAAVEGLTAVEGLKDATTGYGLATTSTAIPAMEKWINEHNAAIDVTKMLNDNIITGTEGNYQFTDSFKNLIIQKQKDVAVTKQLTTEQTFWNAALQIGKQLLVSFAISAFIAGIQKLIQAWKDYRDRFVNGMNDAHSAAENAKADVEEIQSKIDELKQKVKDAGADQISDIVDPAERAKLEAINDNLEKQLDLKKQLQEKEEKEEHKNAVGVYNTKDETVYKDADDNYDYTMGMAPDTAGYKATGTEALDYYSEMLDEYTEKYNKLLETTTDENDPKLHSVKEQMDYAADEVSRLSSSLVDLQGHLMENSDEYNNITNALGTATDALSYYNGDIDVSNSKLTELTDKIKELDSTSKSYYDTVTTNQKYQKYGNIDNTDRGVIRWNKENLQKYSQFAEENSVTEGSYSTVLGSAKEFNKVGEIAYTPMLQTENGVVPLTSSEIGKYLNDVIQKASKMEGGATPENILKVDAEGITETVADETTKVQGMIAAVEGQIKDGAVLTAADVAAISGYSTQELQDEFGEVSKYVGYSMHDIQKSVEEMGDGTAGAIARIQQQVPNLNKNILAQMLMTEGTGFTEETQKGFEVLYEQMNSLGLDVNAENCKLFANALEKLGYISDTTAEKLAKVAENKDKLQEATTGLKNIQSAYGTLSDVVDEYNQNGYLTVSTLTSLIDLGPEYYDCLVDESGQLAINTENIDTMADAYYDMAKAALYAQAIESLDANTNTYANASKFLASAEKQVTDMKSLLYAHSQELIDQGGLTGEALATQVKAQQRIINTYGAMIDLLDKTHAQSAENQFKNPKDKSSSSSSSSSTTDPVSAWETMTAAMKEYNEQGALCVSTLTDLMGLEDEYTSLLDVQNGQMAIDTSSFKNLMLAEIAQANATDDSGKSAYEFKKILEWVDNNVKGTTISYWELVTAIKGYSAALEEAKGKTDGLKDAWDNGKTVKEKLEKSRTGALDYEGTEAQSSALQTVMQYSDYDPKLFNKAYNAETGKIDLSGDVLKDAVVKSLEDQARAASSKGGEAAAAIAKSYQTAADNIKEDVISVQDYFDGLGASIEEASSKIDDLQSAWNDIDDVMDEYNAYGGLSIDSLQKLLTMSPEYLACLQMNGDQLVFNEAAMKQLLIDQIRSRAEFLASKDETKDQAQILYAMIDAIEHDGINAIKGMGTEAKRLQSIFSSIKDVFSSLLDLVNNSNDKKSNDLKIQGEAWIDVIDKRIDALNEANDAQERAIELQKAEDALAKAQANKTVRVYGENGYEWQADASAVRDAQSDLSSKRREYKKQDEIDRLNKLKDKVQETTNLLGTSWEDYQKKLAYTAQFEGMTYDEMIAHNDKFKDAVIANMKAVQAATNVSNIISKLETLIDVLTKLGNVLGRVNGSNTDGGITGLFNRLSNAASKLFDKSSGKGFWGRLGDAAKSLFGGGSSGTGTGGSGFINTITSFFGKAGNKISSAAQSIFTGDSGLFSIFKSGFNKLGSIVSSAAGGSGILSSIGGFFTGIGKTVTAKVLGASGLKAVVTGALSHIPVIGPLLLGGTIALSAIGGGNIFKGISNVVTGIGKTLAKAVKGIGKGISKAAKGIGSMLSSVFHSVVGGTSSNGKKHKGIFGWKIWPWNWGKKASGDKSIKKSGAYNVDEKGEEIIVRQPQKGRVTTLEKGDGVIPANQTETLMGIAKNPIRWLRSNLAKVTGSTAAVVGATKDNADQEAVAQAQETAGKIDSVYSGAFSDIKKVSNAVMKSIKTGSGTIRKVIGGVTSGITGALIGFDSNKVTKSSNTLINSIKKAFDKFKSILGGGSSITGSMDKLLSSSKSKTLAQLDAMKSSFEKTWNEMAEATGVSKDDITATSKEMYDKMTKLVNDTYAAIGDNTALSSEQVEQLTQTLFKSMQSTYTSGWNRIASLTDEMTEEQANKMAIAYKSMSDGCTSTMNSISKTMASSWDKCGGGVRNLSAKTESTISKAWADTTGNTEKMLYDMRACFDNSWGQAKQGVRDLADNTASTINGAYTSIKSTSDETMNTKLPSDMANAWKNVEPGATNLSENIKWTMGQAYDNITKGCNDTVTSIKSVFGTAGNDLYNKGQTTDTAKTDTSKTNTSTTTKSSSSSGSSSSSSGVVSGGQSLPDWFKNSFLAGAKEDYEKAKDKVTSSKTYNYVKDKVTSSSAYQKASSIAKETKEKVSNTAKEVKEKVSNSKIGKAVSSYIDKHKKKASGARKINESDVYNVDEQGSELMVRQPQAGRYTYLETGDGVVPADITSRLFEMGGNPDAWFQNQMSKYGAQITSTGGSNMNVSMGNIVIQNPVGSADDLAGEIVRELPNKLSQYMNLR